MFGASRFHQVALITAARFVRGSHIMLLGFSVQSELVVGR